MGDWPAVSPDGLASQFQAMSLNDPTQMHDSYKSYGYNAGVDAYGAAGWSNPFMQMGVPDPTSQINSPPLTVRVEGLSFQYQFTEDDVRKVFSRYGDVQNVQVGTDGASATVTFANFANGMAAWSDLNGKQLAGINGAYLRVDCPALSQPHHDGMWGPMSAFRQGSGQQNYTLPSYQKYSQNESSPNYSGGQPKNKFTCRLEVGIENEKEFRVGSKVIQVARKIWQELPAFQENGGKTRLRGKGVGGPHESEEALALCISCRDPTCFEQAVQFAETQLKKIHQEFREMCQEKGYPVPELKDVRAVSDHPHAGSGGGPSRDASLNLHDGSFDMFNPLEVQAPKESHAMPNRGKRPDGAPNENDIDGMIEERNEARKAANYKRADEIREFLKVKGVVLMDDKGARGNKKGAQVTKWRYWNP